LYDAVEMNPVRGSDEEGYEPCDDNDPDIVMWSVYLHLKEGGVECVADCPDEDTATFIAGALERAYPTELAAPFGARFS
jgi:hypothetical protein